jgi:hypothetical protein
MVGGIALNWGNLERIVNGKSRTTCLCRLLHWQTKDCRMRASAHEVVRQGTDRCLSHNLTLVIVATNHFRDIGL